MIALPIVGRTKGKKMVIVISNRGQTPMIFYQAGCLLFSFSQPIAFAACHFNQLITVAMVELLVRGGLFIDKGLKKYRKGW